MTTILFFHSNILKPGGASRVVLEQASRLQKLGFNCPIITTKVNSEITRNYSDLSFYCLSSFSTGQFFFWLTFPLFFAKLISQTKRLLPEAIYCHSLALYWGFLYKLFYPQSKLIIYFHDIGFPYFDSSLETASLRFPFPQIINFVKPIFSSINQQIIKKTNHLIANSQTSAKFIFQKYHRQPDSLIYPGFDESIFHPGTTAKGDYLVTVGRLEKIKNISTIISALPPKQKLIIAGDGPEKANLQQQAYKLNKNVVFLGNQTPSQLAPLYQKARLGIFMSPAESFGLVAVECLACGTPIIGVNKNGIAEISQQFNQLLIKNCPTALHQLLTQKIPLKKLASFSVTPYSATNQAQQLAQFFNQSL
ncbi:glycosyltransferase family 4 protein [Candidatus Shapirobacteria bacterium]|nr:glycosyltransferase family 4 protein [Candidatus Shapirobacteria bacterium]